MRTTYPTDLTDAEWNYIEPHLPAPKATGRPPLYPLREILNAIFYVLRSGCSWRLVPHDFPPWRRASTTASGGSAWMEPGRGCTPPCASGLEFALREEPPAQRGHRRQPVSQDYRGRCRRARLRWRQESKGQSKRHLLVDTEGFVLKANGRSTARR